MVALLAAWLVASAAWSQVTPSARAASVCTGWASNAIPPSTIRVLRSSGPSAGAVEVVPFRQYVNTVIAAEWGASAPTEALRVGAIAVKQYAWYWTIVWRGKKAADGSCYDVVDTTTDQLYKPEKYGPARSHLDAIDATWTTSLRKGGRLWPTGYRSGSSVDCGMDADGWILYQISLYRCARAGETMDILLHRYLDPGLKIVRPGSGDSTGDGLGDVVVVSPGDDPSWTAVRLYSAGKATTPVPVVATAFGAPSVVPLAHSATVFRQFVDLTGDRLDDMVALLRVSEAQYQFWVSPATGDGFGQPAFLWDSLGSAIALTPTALVRFVADDFTGDGRPDLALLVGEPGGSLLTSLPTPTPGPTPTPDPNASASPNPGESALAVGDPNAFTDPGATGSPAPGASTPPPPVPGPTASNATLWLFRANGSGLDAPLPIWIGPLELTGTVAFAGDVDGDESADLVVQLDMTSQPVPAAGLRYVLIRMTAATGGPLELWLDLPDTPATSIKSVVADVNGDSRDDIVIDRPAGTTGSQLLGLMSTGSSFALRSLWSKSSSFRWSASRIAAADVNGDGRGDIVVLYNAGASGSRFYQFISTGSSLRSLGSTTDPSLPWAGAAPY